MVKKRTLCSFFKENRCTRGAACSFAHAEEEFGQEALDTTKFKVEQCTHFLAGYCERGEDCCFAHGEADVGTLKPLAGNGKNSGGKGGSGKDGTGKASGGKHIEKNAGGKGKQSSERCSGSPRRSDSRDGRASGKQGERKKVGGVFAKNVGNFKAGVRASEKCEALRLLSVAPRGERKNRRSRSRSRPRMLERIPRRDSSLPRRARPRSRSRPQPKVLLIIIQTCPICPLKQLSCLTKVWANLGLNPFGPIWAHWSWAHLGPLSQTHLGPLRPSSFGCLGPETYLGPGPFAV